MARSPAYDKDGVLRVTVYVEGEPMPADYQLVALDVHNAVNRIGKAALVLHVRDTEWGQISVADGPVFEPGKAIAVSAGYGDDEDSIFEGMVTALQLNVDGTEGIKLAVECRDLAYPMTQGNRQDCYEDMSDGDIIEQVIGNYKLEANVASGTVVHERVVQYFQNDWDFIRRCADAQGWVLITNGTSISVKPPDLAGAPTLVVTYGVDMVAFDAEWTAMDQSADVVVRAWDPVNQSVLSVSAESATLNDQGDMDIAKLEAVAGQAVHTVAAQVADEQRMQQEADARKLRQGLARIRGTCTFVGSAHIQPGQLLELAGMGMKFNGNGYVGGVWHTVNNDGWLTQVTLGLPQDENVASGRFSMSDMEGVAGLHVGVVVKLVDDPKNEFRVAIQLPMIDQPAKQVWARLAGSWAGNGYGALNVPDVGDEVVVGFQHGDPSHPIILGSLYSSKRVRPEELKQENDIHGIKTKSGITVTLDDDQCAVNVATPGGITIRASDKDKSVSVADMNGNKLSLSDGGIRLDAQKDIQIATKGNITMEAQGQLQLKGTAGAALSGSNVAIKADTSATVKGNASAELSAAGQTVVKGAMVMIN